MTNTTDLMATNVKEVDFLFGLFGESHVAFHDVRVPERDPSLTNMTMKALQVSV